MLGTSLSLLPGAWVAITCLPPLERCRKCSCSGPAQRWVIDSIPWPFLQQQQQQQQEEVVGNRAKGQAFRFILGLHISLHMRLVRWTWREWHLWNWTAFVPSMEACNFILFSHEFYNISVAAARITAHIGCYLGLSHPRLVRGPDSQCPSLYLLLERPCHVRVKHTESGGGQSGLPSSTVYCCVTSGHMFNFFVPLMALSIKWGF